MRAGLREQLLDLLSQEAEVAADVSAALDRERALIAGRDDEALGRAVSEKAELIARLEALESQRNRAVESIGPSEKDFATLAQDLDPSGELTRLWRQLSELAESCREKNLINSNLVSLSLQAVGEALSILRGSETPTALYDPLGRAVSGGGSRSLAKA